MATEEVNESDACDVDEQSTIEDRRVVLRVQGKAVTSSITQIWRAQFNGVWDTWKMIPQEEKDIWFDAFKAKYKWDTRIEGDVKKLFDIVGSKSLRDFMCKARNKPSTEKPPFLNLTAWQTLCRGWKSTEFVVKSDRGKVARQANKRLHTGGSISIVEHKRRMHKELTREPRAAELFARNHKKKDNTFVDNEAQETWEQYNDKYGVDDSLDAESENMSNTYPRWVDHVGIKNGRVYGEGSGVDEYTRHRYNIDEPFNKTSDNQDLQDLIDLQHTEQILKELILIV